MLGCLVLVMGVTAAQLPVAPATEASNPPPRVQEAKATVPGGFIEMFVATVMPTSDGHTVVLVNPDEEMLLPVGVALPEAVTIYGRLEHKRGPRPMTHDVLDGVVAGLGARVLRVQIDDLVDGTFIGTVVMQGKGGTPFSIDARAADALAIALSAKAPIYVAKPVMDRAALSHDDLKRVPSPADGAGGSAGGGGAPPPPVGEDEPAIRVFDL